MAHIFKHPTYSSKGIIVFTHKEIQYFSTFWKETRYDLINRLLGLFISRKNLKRHFKKHFNEIRKKYWLGIHFGYFHCNYPTLPYVDFYMSGPGTVTYEDQVFHIPLCSRNFTPDYFYHGDDLDRKWDLLCVTTAFKPKNSKEFLHVSRQLLNTNPDLKILLIITGKKNEKKSRFDTSLVDDYFSLFSFDERKKFVLLKTSSELGMMGMEQSFVADFFRRAKVFTLFSLKEGESRVIAEALLSGCKIVVSKHLVGGGRDYLDNDNSNQFNDFGVASNTILKAIINFRKTDLSERLNELRESYSVNTLHHCFKEFYLSKGSTYDQKLINTDNLAKRLPAHFQDVPWNRGRMNTADIMTKRQFKIFRNNLKLM